jgi:hypothetical protein
MSQKYSPHDQKPVPDTDNDMTRAHSVTNLRKDTH